MHLKYTEILPTITQENIRNCRQYLWIVRDNIFNNKNSTLQLLFLFYRAVTIYKNAMTAYQSIEIKSLFRNRLKLFPEYRRKTSRSKGENQQQTQPTYGVDAGIWTWTTLVGGECSHHCATLAPKREKRTGCRVKVTNLSEQSLHHPVRNFLYLR